MSSIPPDASKPLSTSADRPHAPPTDEEAIYFAGSPLLGGHPEKALVLVLAGAFFMIIPIIIKMVFRHQIQLAELSMRAQSSPEMLSEIQELKKQVGDLRELVTDIALSTPASSTVQARIREQDAR